MSGLGILFYGDPHGHWDGLFSAVKQHAPAAVVVAGDCDLDEPITGKLRDIIDAGIRLRWIHGNHDADRVEWWDRLMGDQPQWNLHATYAQLDGRIVAGLGGIYKSSVWYPRFKDQPSEPLIRTRKEAAKRTERAMRIAGGLPFHHLDSVFPEDHDRLKQIRADILVTHEAPSCHKYGFAGLDELARGLRVKLIVHGHHHTSYVDQIDDGNGGFIKVKGLGRAEPWFSERQGSKI
jgi:predicted phosphodiesterase